MEYNSVCNHKGDKQKWTTAHFFLITSMITDWIGQHEVLLSIKHAYNKTCDILASSNQKTWNSKSNFASNEKRKQFKDMHDGVYCPVTQAWHLLSY